jgi:mannosyl-3-phosphoglycerate phosphatase
MLPSPLVLFTEPLGLLLRDGRPAWVEAEKALAEIARRNVPLIFASRGTRMELEFLRRKIGNQHPFLSENGGALFIPHGYFRARIPDATTTTREYHTIAYGRPYGEVTEALEEIAQKAGVDTVGFHQMSARETAENSGLPLKIAQLARMREFDEPFFFAGETPQAVARFEAAARARGFRCYRGDRFWHLTAGADAARGVRRLLELYRGERRARVRAVAIGSRASELAVLAATPQSILLPGLDGEFDPELLARLPGAKRCDSSGAAGWNNVVLNLLSS